MSKLPSIGMSAKEPGLGFQFLAELREAYLRFLDHPLGYQALRSGIRRALTRRFPHAIYFSIEGDLIVILAVFTQRVIPQSGSAESEMFC